jgi:hypothetical protein
VVGMPSHVIHVHPPAHLPIERASLMRLHSQCGAPMKRSYGYVYAESHSILPASRIARLQDLGGEQVHQLPGAGCWEGACRVSHLHVSAPISMHSMSYVWRTPENTRGERHGNVSPITSSTVHFAFASCHVTSSRRQCTNNHLLRQRSRGRALVGTLVSLTNGRSQQEKGLKGTLGHFPRILKPLAPKPVRRHPKEDVHMGGSRRHLLLSSSISGAGSSPSSPASIEAAAAGSGGGSGGSYDLWDFWNADPIR